jgi:DNA topoisomerase-3
VGNLKVIWPKLSGDERRLFDVIARSYLAAVMPDHRYRQTTATLDVHGHAFRAVGRQPIELGWRAAFPDWRPAEETGEDAQPLPALRHGEATRLSDAAVEDKETRPPPRYNEGTLVEAMQNAWRFIEDTVLRERLREAKGIGTPATRAEIIRGLKAQEVLAADGKHIVPTERGLALYGVLERADPALVDPGVTAQLELLLDEILVGRAEMMGAIDAVCAQAQRIIARLTEGAGAEAGLIDAGPAVRPAPAATRRGKGQKAGPARKAATKRPRAGNKGAAAPQAADTPLRIPFGNKETAQQLGARYRAGGWYAPPGTALDPFRERGWL